MFDSSNGSEWFMYLIDYLYGAYMSSYIVYVLFGGHVSL
jgi:hypothetical protein